MLTDYVQQKDKHNRIFVVHRLDEDTSGVLMVSKSQKLQDALQNDWNNLVKKRGYYAIVEGHLKDKQGTIKSYLKKNAQNMMYSSKKAGDGQLAITNYKVMSEIDGYSLEKNISICNDIRNLFGLNKEQEKYEEDDRQALSLQARRGL